MSRPAKRIEPESGGISPASCPISVVLPAPFGPMTACSSPASTASVMASEATTPPNRRVSPSTWRRGSATAEPHEHAVDAAAREQHHEQQQGPEHDGPVF